MAVVKRSSFIKILSFLLIASVVGSAGYKLYKRYYAVKPVQAIEPAYVSSGYARLEDIPRFLSTFGSIQAIESVAIASESPGRIKQIFFKSGMNVQENDPLIQLNDQVEQAELLRFQAQLLQTETDFKRASDLSLKNFESRADYDKKKAAYSQAKAQVQQAQAVINNKLIKAPFSGHIGIHNIALGQYLQPGAEIVSLTNVSSLYLNFTLPEQDFSKVFIGQHVFVSVDALQNKKIECQITSIEPKIKEDNRVFLVQAVIDNKDQLLAPGMFAHVDVLLKDQGKTLVVPETAVDYGFYGACAYVLMKQFNLQVGRIVLTAQRRSVKVGTRYRNRTEILEGLKKDEQIIVTGLNKVGDGTYVSIDNTVQLNAKPSYDY